MTKSFNVELSRRAVFAGLLTVALVSAGLGAAAASAQNEKRLNQTAPKGNARCDNCASRVSAPSCKLVAGIVGPSGRYILYLEKAATQKEIATRCAPKG
jgi:hypothetical protein